MLDHAMRRGLTGAIVHSSKILPLHKIPQNEVEAAEDLIFDRRREGHDPLQAFMALFADRAARPRSGSGRRRSRSGWRSVSSTATRTGSRPISTRR